MPTIVALIVSLFGRLSLAPLLLALARLAYQVRTCGPSALSTRAEAVVGGALHTLAQLDGPLEVSLEARPVDLADGLAALHWLGGQLDQIEAPQPALEPHLAQLAEDLEALCTDLEAHLAQLAQRAPTDPAPAPAPRDTVAALDGDDGTRQTAPLSEAEQTAALMISAHLWSFAGEAAAAPLLALVPARRAQVATVALMSACAGLAVNDGGQSPEMVAAALEGFAARLRSGDAEARGAAVAARARAVAVAVAEAVAETEEPAIINHRPCYACDEPAAGLRDRRPEGGAVELACGRHRDPALRVSHAHRCEGCARVAGPLAFEDTPRGPRWLCGACLSDPAIGARPTVLDLSGSAERAS